MAAHTDVRSTPRGRSPFQSGGRGRGRVAASPFSRGGSTFGRRGGRFRGGGDAYGTPVRPSGTSGPFSPRSDSSDASEGTTPVKKQRAGALAEGDDRLFPFFILPSRREWVVGTCDRRYNQTHLRVKYGRFTSSEALGLSGAASVGRFVDGLEKYLADIMAGSERRRSRAAGGDENGVSGSAGGDGGGDRAVSGGSRCTIQLSLNLQQNVIGDKAVEALVEGLMRIKSSMGTSLCLRSVLLYFNLIGDRGAFALAGLLRRCGEIREVHLSHNRITDQGAQAVLEALRADVRPRKVWLRMEWNAISSVSSLFPRPQSEHPDTYVGQRDGYEKIDVKKLEGTVVGTPPVVDMQKQVFAECEALREAREGSKGKEEGAQEGKRRKVPAFFFLDTSAVVTMLGRVGLMERLRGLAKLEGGQRVFLVLLDVVRNELDGLKDRMHRSPKPSERFVARAIPSFTCPTDGSAWPHVLQLTLDDRIHLRHDNNNSGNSGGGGGEHAEEEEDELLDPKSLNQMHDNAVIKVAQYYSQELDTSVTDRHVVIITGDKAMRAKCQERGVPSILTNDFLRAIEPLDAWESDTLLNAIPGAFKIQGGEALGMPVTGVVSVAQRVKGHLEGLRGRLREWREEGSGVSVECVLDQLEEWVVECEGVLGRAGKAVWVDDARQDLVETDDGVQHALGSVTDDRDDDEGDEEVAEVDDEGGEAQDQDEDVVEGGEDANGVDMLQEVAVDVVESSDIEVEDVEGADAAHEVLGRAIADAALDIATEEVVGADEAEDEGDEDVILLTALSDMSLRV